MYLSELPILTSQYDCPRCGNPLTLDGMHDEKMSLMRRDSAHCGVCDTRIPLAGVLHRCPSCATVLESPNCFVGSSFTCPTCGADDSTIPDSILLFDDDEAVEPELHFLIRCPSCDEEQVARQCDVGRISPCLFCYAAIEIPMAGEAVPVVPESQCPVAIHACAACGLKIDKKLHCCPFCEHVN